MRTYPGPPADAGDPPVCALPGCQNPVKWDASHGTAKVGWRRYCSRVCSGADATKIGPLTAWNRERSKQFYVTIIKEVMGSRWRSGLPATVEQLVALVRHARMCGYNSAYQVERRRTRKRAA